MNVPERFRPDPIYRDSAMALETRSPMECASWIAALSWILSLPTTYRGDPR